MIAICAILDLIDLFNEISKISIIMTIMIKITMTVNLSLTHHIHHQDMAISHIHSDHNDSLIISHNSFNSVCKALCQTLN